MKWLLGLLDWFWKLIRLKPHYYIGGFESPYLIRWYIFPRNHWWNLYLHKFMRDDDDRALHDHPWWFWSFMLRGEYTEYLGEDVSNTGMNGFPIHVRRKAGSLVFRRAEHRHRVSLPKNPDGTPQPCWTLVLTGPKSRLWGFWCPQGFVPWYDFVEHTATGNTGKGCGEH